MGSKLTSVVNIAIVSQNHANQVALKKQSQQRRLDSTVANNTLATITNEGRILTYSGDTSKIKDGMFVVKPDGKFQYVPPENVKTATSLTYVINETNIESNLEPLTITINSLDPTPYTKDVKVRTYEKVPTIINVRNNVTVACPDTKLKFSFTLPRHGDLKPAKTPGIFKYIAKPNFSGNDVFTYTVTNSYGEAATANVSINVIAAPTAANGILRTNINTLKSNKVNAIDVANGHLIYLVVTPPTHGTLVMETNGAYTYKPDKNFSGGDSFTYIANNGRISSNVATVTIKVNQISELIASTTCKHSFDKELKVNKENSNLFYKVVIPPVNGTVTMNPLGNFTYKPNANFSGIDAFQYVISDKIITSEPALIYISVLELNNNSIKSDEDIHAITSSVMAREIDVNITKTHIFGIKVQPTNGKISVDETGKYIYTPN